MNGSSAQMIVDYLNKQGKYVYAKYVEAMAKEIAILQGAKNTEQSHKTLEQHG